MYSLNDRHSFNSFLIISSIGIAWIVCLCNWHHINCWLRNLDERRPIKSAYPMQVLDHCHIGLRDILQVDLWSFVLYLIGQFQLSLFLHGTNIWYSDITVVY